jgi:hypothetical protein
LLYALALENEADLKAEQQALSDILHKELAKRPRTSAAMVATNPMLIVTTPFESALR